VTTGGTLFTVDVKSVAGDGTGSITVTSVKVRDCDNQPLPGVPGAPALLTINNTGPSPITDLAAAQVTSGNPPGPTTGIAVTWASGGGGTVSLYRAPFGSYPEYDDNGPTSPPNPAAAPGAPWTLVSASALPGFVDLPAGRGFWYYVAFVTDACGTRSAVSNRSAGALSYHLGDVSNGFTAGLGDNRVGLEDISLLGANYGIGESTITARGGRVPRRGPDHRRAPDPRAR